MADLDFTKQIEGYGLSTVQVHYYMPDHPGLIQIFVMQQYDIAPRFPELDRFLDYWRREGWRCGPVLGECRRCRHSEQDRKRQPHQMIPTAFPARSNMPMIVWT